MSQCDPHQATPRYNLQALIDQEQALETQVPDLPFRCHDLIKENETAQARVSQVKPICLGVVELLRKWYNQVKRSQSALSKKDYGSSILQTVEMAIITLTRAAKTIFDCLADNDEQPSIQTHAT